MAPSSLGTAGSRCLGVCPSVQYWAGRGYGSRWAVPLALFLLIPVAAAAQPSPGPASAPWRAQIGDDPRWARPSFDDSAWPRVPLTSTWGEQGYQGHDGMVWYRRVVSLGEVEEARLAARRDPLGLLVGPPTYGGYEVYAGGRLLGRSRGWLEALPFGFPEVFRVPRDAIGKRGLVLALRVRRVGWVSDLDEEGAPVGGVLILGSEQALRDRARVAWTENLLSELPLIVLAVLFTAAALYHFLLFSRRRKQIEHLWFGLLSLAFASNTFASTYWIYQMTASYGLAVRISGLTGHLAAALAIQFLWGFFSRPIRRPLRLYQLSHVALARFVGLWPDVQPVVASSRFRSALAAAAVGRGGGAHPAGDPARDWGSADHRGRRARDDRRRGPRAGGGISRSPCRGPSLSRCRPSASRPCWWRWATPCPAGSAGSTTSSTGCG